MTAAVVGLLVATAGPAAALCEMPPPPTHVFLARAIGGTPGPDGILMGSATFQVLAYVIGEGPEQTSVRTSRAASGERRSNIQNGAINSALPDDNWFTPRIGELWEIAGKRSGNLGNTVYLSHCEGGARLVNDDVAWLRDNNVARLRGVHFGAQPASPPPADPEHVPDAGAAFTAAAASSQPALLATLAALAAGVVVRIRSRASR